MSKITYTTDVAHCNLNLCEYLGVQLDCVFKKSDKKFEK